MFCSEVVIHGWSWIVYNKFVIHYKNWVFCNELAFAAELCILQRNCDSLLKLSCLQRSGFRSRIACSAAKLWVADEAVSTSANLSRCRNWVFCIWICNLLPSMSCLQLICNSLPQLSSLQQINILCQIGCSAVNLWIAAEIELSTSN